MTPQSYPYGPDLIPSTPDPDVGIWRWHRLLPLDGRGRYPLQIGETPLVDEPVADEEGVGAGGFHRGG